MTVTFYSFFSVFQRKICLKSTRTFDQRKTTQVCLEYENCSFFPMHAYITKVQLRARLLFFVDLKMVQGILSKCYTFFLSCPFSFRPFYLTFAIIFHNLTQKYKNGWESPAMQNAILIYLKCIKHITNACHCNYLNFNTIYFYILSRNDESVVAFQ